MKTLPFVIAAFGILLAPVAPAGEPIKPGVTPEAYQVIKAVSDFHKTLPAAAAEIKLTLSQEVPGNPKRESTMKATFAAERPRHFKLQLDGEQGGIAIVCDGQTVWTYLPELKQYTVDTAPMNLEILLRYHDAAPKAMSQLGLLCELFRKEPATLILDSVTSLKVAGSDKIEGVECIRLRGEQEDMDWEAWFEKGDKPMLRKFNFDPLKGMLAIAPAEMRERLKGIKLEGTVEYGWKDGAKAADGGFAYVPPAGAQKVQHFVENEPEPAGGDPAPGGGVAAGPDTLKGKPAPDFTLETLTGGKLHLAELKGKVVVLDFWASWCGPCVAALPQISEASKARAEKGVVFYAVNQQEEVPEIKAFLQKKNLDVPVALDVEGAAAKLYHVRGIPQTVVIDKEGNVAVVHVGFSPKMKEQLGRELDELLAK